MRRRNIKSVAHWVIMSVVLLFPILMVGISSFAQPQQEINVTESYEYETNEVNSVDDLVVGNIYKAKLNLNNYIMDSTILELSYFRYNDNQSGYIFINVTGPLQLTTYISGGQNLYRFRILDSDIGQWSYLPISIQNEYEFYFVYKSITTTQYSDLQIIESDYLGEKTIDYTITDETMREDVNQWCASFRNLPVNQWYGNLLTAVGLGITTSMMMNVIYTYPLYVLWVYILDLVVDIFLVIINFGHNALKRLGGDNE